MANPQPDEFTKLSNELLEALCRTRIPGEAMQCLLFIFRKTYGFNKKSDKISLGQFEEATKMPRPTCARAIKKLLNMNIIIAEKDKLKVTFYSLNKDYETWKTLSKKIMVKTKSIDKNDNLVLSKMITDLDKNDNKVLSYLSLTKESKEIFKERFKERKKNYKTVFHELAEEFELSDDLKKVFLIWFKYKAEKNQSYTVTGMRTLIKTKLLETSGNIERLKEMILFSISNNYQGLFEKENKNGRTKSTEQGIAAIGNKYFPDEV